MQKKSLPQTTFCDLSLFSVLLFTNTVV
uniref:Uncharacterized protein n=1 Tax=Anguilla anguilla TaxID=7936 RepID=A0A0E9SCD8_ANGAN